MQSLARDSVQQLRPTDEVCCDRGDAHLTASIRACMTAAGLHPVMWLWQGK